jgi:hypothetical protein
MPRLRPQCPLANGTSDVNFELLPLASAWVHVDACRCTWPDQKRGMYGGSGDGPLKLALRDMYR